MIIGFTSKIVFVFSKFNKIQQLFYELLNQYQACLYLFEYIFSMVIPNVVMNLIRLMLTFFKRWWPCWTCRLLTVCSVMVNVSMCEGEIPGWDQILNPNFILSYPKFGRALHIKCDRISITFCIGLHIFGLQ